MSSGYNITDLVREAKNRWLKPAEVLFILQNHEIDKITHVPVQKPPSGSLFLFNKRVLRFFRKDGHSWRRKKDGRTVGEAHERLKVGNVEALNCYYAHGEQNSNFQRRSYWMLDPAHEHIVLVHYRDISEVRENAVVNVLQSSPESATFSLSPSCYSTQQLASSMVIHESYQLNQNLSSPGSGEISSDAVIKSNGVNRLDIVCGAEDCNASQSLELSQALRRLEEQLCLNEDSILDIGAFYNEIENSDDFDNVVCDQSSYKGMQLNSNGLPSLHHSGDSIDHHHHLSRHDADIWKEMLDGFESSQNADLQANFVPKVNDNGLLQDAPRKENVEGHESYTFLDFGGNNAQTSTSIPQEVEAFKYHAYPTALCANGTNPDDYTAIFDQGHMRSSLEDGLRLTIAQKQKFTIQEISPEWGYASEATKVIIIGSFLCDPSESVWACMFGDIEVPVQIVREGVMKCLAPPNLPGKVTLCITSGNRESSSEVREFEYRVKSNICAHNDHPENDSSRSPEELSLLVRLAQLLVIDSRKRDSDQTGSDLLINSRAGEDSWKQVMEVVLGGTWTSSFTTDWLLQELLKDKLQQWLYSRSQEDIDQLGCYLPKKEQGIIHMIAGLGFEWALQPILKSGVSVNFRDINGWAPLHWAARFGREKMVAALMASGASAGAVTDPNPEDPVGRTPASIAAAYGHRGLAGYLSEVALTSHLSSLTLEESELSKGSAEVEAERTVSYVSNASPTTDGDQLSLKETLAAVRNSAQAAARIQSAFRAHSFRKKELREAAASFASARASGDEYIILSNEIQGLSAASKFASRGPREYHLAAVSIQKKYRGWKGRKNFLAFRQKVVKIQAHIRGYQVRKQYHVCWAVGVLEKVVLRWRRHGVGLRGFRHETEYIGECEDEDILKVFRKKKVDAVLDEAVSRVLLMVECPEARQQYRRILEKYRQAKAELGGVEKEMERSL